MRLATFQIGKGFILYDAGILCDAALASQIAPVELNPAWFTAAFWQARSAVVGQAAGRGASLFVDASAVAVADQQWVLRAYRRGGFAARISESHYLWTGLERTRAFHELRLNAALYDLSLIHI